MKYNTVMDQDPSETFPLTFRSIPLTGRPAASAEWAWSSYDESGADRFSAGTSRSGDAAEPRRHAVPNTGWKEEASANAGGEED